MSNIVQQQQVAFDKAFLVAQQAMRDPCKDGSNPHFKSRFVSLKGVCDAVRRPLHDAGITFKQLIDFDDPDRPYVRTVLTHIEGGGEEGRCPIYTAKKNDPQALGSAITYARRYGLAAICGLAPSDEDDDGESAVDRSPVKVKAKPARPAPTAIDTPDMACMLLAKCNSDQSVDFVVSRIMRSDFAPEELAIVKESTIERRAIIAEGGS
jgi:hypothetical protein